jgi:glycine/D-amino acid oxidase-like deaminating enzyme
MENRESEEGKTENRPFFLENAGKRYVAGAGLEGAMEADVLIVGAGMAGLSAAYNLSKRMDPSKIALIDSGRPGFSTTGLSAGLLVDSVEEDFEDMDPKVYGEVKKGLAGIVAAVETEKLDCDLRKLPSVYFAADEDQVETIQDEYNARKEAGFNVELMDGNQLKGKTGIEGKSAMVSKEGYCVDPARFCQEMVRVLKQRGVRIYENTKLNSHDRKEKKALTEGGEVKYQKLVLTNTDAALRNVQLKGKAMLLSTAVAVTEPLNDKQYASVFGNGECTGWDASDVNYTYFRPVGNKQILIGGSDRLASVRDVRTGNLKTEKDRVNLTSAFKRTFPSLRDVKFSNTWTGVVPASVDGSPFVGEFQPDHYLGLYSPGLPNAYRTGEILAELVTGEMPKEDNVFSHDRKIPLKVRARALTKYQPCTAVANKLFFD